MSDPYADFKFHVVPDPLDPQQVVRLPPPPSVVERLAGLEDDEIRERNRRLDVTNSDLERWRQTVEGAGAPTLTGELTITEPDGRVAFKGRAALVDIKPSFDDLPPGIEMVEVDLE